MPTETTRTRAASLAELDPGAIVDEYPARGLDRLSDGALAELVAASLARPKLAPADSFILHAPLELLARVALLPLVDPGSRHLARQRLVWLGATYQAAGAEVPDLRLEPDPFARPSDTVGHLEAAINAGEIDDADALAAGLAASLTPAQLSRALTDVVLPRLSAAAHGNILLFQLSRIAPRSPVAAASVRGIARELARYPDWALTWSSKRGPGAPHRGVDQFGVGPDEVAGDLVEPLLGPASPGDPGSTFIFPTMSLMETSGLAVELLDLPTRVTYVARAQRDLLRVAAWSMIQDAPDHAPYGWSHCLTLPQAALGIAEGSSDPSMAIAVAATYVLGFRSTLGRVVLAPEWVPPRPDGDDVLGALDASPAEAAAAVWHASPDALGPVTARLATTASTHPDAHLAKYTLACFDAAHADPEASRLYLAAAAYLGAWWAQLPLLDDPLLS
jgi:hypothetical protein